VSEEPSADRVVAIPPEQERAFTSHVGMIIFLGSWAMMFGALFFSYAMLRARAKTWPPEGVDLPLLLPLVNTVVMVGSELLLVRANRLARAGRAGAIATPLLSAIVLGTVFMVLQGLTWWRAWSSGVLPGSGALGSVFWTLTCFHALHVLVGLGLLVALVPWALRRPHEMRSRMRLRLVSMFWHFVGIAWVLIFVSVFVA
jgi:cytochrome c oxidase subunit 3